MVCDMAVLGTMFTFTTYGTWLRGDMRGWVDDGRLMPPNPILETADRARMQHEPLLFARNELLKIGAMIGESFRDKQERIFALTIQVWHVHIAISRSPEPPGEIAKRVKEAVRYGLLLGRPIWTAGYDKRFCFDEIALRKRIGYVERHNLAQGWPARPWDFIVPF